MEAVRPAGAAPLPARTRQGLALAIVVVVAGLILGGFLKGRELIAAARGKATVADVEAILEAAARFRERYGGLPGDSAKAQGLLGTPNGIVWTSPRCDGSDQGCDGDGIIEGNGRSNESLLFWQHLAADHLITGIAVGSVVDDSIGAGLPAAAIGGGFAVQHHAIGGRTAHWMRLGTGANLTTGVVSGEQAHGIDRALDDGAPATGSVRVTTPACVDRGAYDPAGVRCLIYFQLDSGEPG